MARRFEAFAVAGLISGPLSLNNVLGPPCLGAARSAEPSLLHVSVRSRASRRARGSTGIVPLLPTFLHLSKFCHARVPINRGDLLRSFKVFLFSSAFQATLVLGRRGLVQGWFGVHP